MYRIIPEDEWNKRNGNGKNRGRRGRGGNQNNGNPAQRMRDAEKFLDEAKADYEDYLRTSKRKMFAPGFWSMVAWSPVIGTFVGGVYLGIGYIAWNILKSTFNIH